MGGGEGGGGSGTGGIGGSMGVRKQSLPSMAPRPRRTTSLFCFSEMVHEKECGTGGGPISKSMHPTQTHARMSSKLTMPSLAASSWKVVPAIVTLKADQLRKAHPKHAW